MSGGGAGPTRAGLTRAGAARLFQIVCMFLLWRIGVAKVVKAAIFLCFTTLHGRPCYAQWMGEAGHRLCDCVMES